MMERQGRRGQAVKLLRVRVSQKGLEDEKWGAVMTWLPWAHLLFVAVLLTLVRSGAATVIPKCCPLGQSYVGGACTTLEDDSPIWSLRLHSPSPSGPVPLESAEYNFTWAPLSCVSRTVHDDKHFIYTDASIDRDVALYSRSKDYCIEFFADFNETFPVFCMVDHGEEPDWKYFIMGLGFFFSVPFCLATIFIYLFIKELCTLHGRIIIRNMSSFVVASIIQGMTSTQIIKPYIGFDLVCGLAGYAIQFFFMATFFWLNVMCFDIYWTFSGLRNLEGSMKERERKKLILYSIYAWCTPLLILVITVAMDLSPSIPSTSIFKPRVGENICFFKEIVATWIYFYLPMTLIIVSNMFLFGVTVYRIWSLKRDTKMISGVNGRKHVSNNDKERFSLYLKLFIVMGINWVMELISSVVSGPKYLWYVPDLINTLQGFFIFLIFVWKKRVRKLVWAKLCSCFGKEIKTNSRTLSGSSCSKNSNNNDSTRTSNSLKMTTVAHISQTARA